MNPFAGTTGQPPLRPQTPHLQNVGFPSFTVPTPPPVPSHSTSSMLEGTMFTPTSSTTPVSAATMSPRSNDPLSQKEFVDPHIMYYLNTVLPSQYPIVSESMTSIMHNIMTSEAPHYGAVTHASCALASLHNKSIRVARGLDQPDLDPQYSTASQFYNKAYLLLCPTKTGPTAYTEYDALAALQLVSYWVLFGGAGQWSELLDAARGWIVTTGLPTHENPRLALLELSQVGKLVVKITMWFDVFSSITSMQAPRFMGLYQRLLSTGTNGFWARGEHDVRMDNLMGCTDDVMLAFAEIADLAAWKAHEQITGRLSVRTLVHRGEEIEARLRNGTLAEARVGGTGTPALLEPISAGLVVASNTSPANRQGSNASSTSSSASTPPSITIHPATTTLTTSPETTLTSLPAIDNGRGGLATVFREAACLYLHTVVNESRPGVPEVANAVTALMAAFQSCPPTLTDRMLTLPLCLAGCLASQPIHRDYIDKRLAAQEEAVWNAKMIRIIVARVAAMRSQNATAVVDWRSAIHEYLMHEGLVQESLLV